MLRLLPPSLSLLRGVLCCANQTPKMAHANISTQTPNYKNTQTYERTKEEKAKEQSNSSALRSFFFCLFRVFLISRFCAVLQRARDKRGSGSSRQHKHARGEQRRRNPRVRFCPTCVSVCVCVSLSLFFRPRTKTDNGGEKCLLF